MKRLAIIIIRLYQYILSPWVGNNCRFYPTCSQYTLASVERFGFYGGLLRGLKRLLRCHPWCKNYGYDPVQEKNS